MEVPDKNEWVVYELPEDVNYDEKDQQADPEDYYSSDEETNVEDKIRTVNKRHVLPVDEDDLETAAGTNVLRPLFVYRQQVAYRQRLRNKGDRRRFVV